MGRKAKHNWEKMFRDFCQGGYATIAAYARKHKLNVNQVRDEFRKLNGTRSKIMAEANGENGNIKEDNRETENKSVGQKTENRKTEKQEKPPIGGRQLDENGLTAQQKLFVSEYLLDFNATRAAMAAGYSKRTAYAIGWNLIRKPAIQQELQRQTEGDVIRLGINRERVLLEYMKIAFANVGDYVRFGQKEVPVIGPDGPIFIKSGDGGEREEEGCEDSVQPLMRKVNYVDFESSEAVDTTLIAEVKQGRDGCSIKLHDKMKALEKLEKYLDLLPDEHKRRVENERLRMEQERLELEKKKAEIDEGGGEKEIYVDTTIPGIDDEGEQDEGDQGEGDRDD